MQNSPGDKHCP